MIEHEPLSPAFMLAIALAAGTVCQSLARHLRLPGIVLLLGTGVLLGPDVLDLLEPEALGEALGALVGFAVAIILFEGGMNLNVRRVRREAVAIRRLITIGALVTATGGAITARLAMGWDWRLSILFGTLVIVTGPTVITPLLKRIRVKNSVETILEAEGVLIDAIGAIIAVVALEVAISPSGRSLAEGALSLVARLGLGTLLGVLGGLAIAGLLRLRRVVPDGLENVFTLSMVLVLFHLTDHLLHESGIAAVTAAGLVVGNVRTRVTKDLLEFKEQLTVLLIGVLFVLLAADVRLAEVRGLGLPGLITVIALMVVVRPINVLASTVGSEVAWRERVFISWLAPRGIVAAAVASLFAESLALHDIEGGSALRALVFLVIAVTVVVQGLTGGVVARLLGLARASRSGYAILGANSLALTVGEELAKGGEPVVFIDASAEHCHAAERAGYRVVFGNALEERSLQRAQVDARVGAIALTENEEVNQLFAGKVREEAPGARIWVALHRGHTNIKPGMVHALGGRVLFGDSRRLALWSMRVERGHVVREAWRWSGSTGEAAPVHDAGPSPVEGGRSFALDERFLLPIVHVRGQVWRPVDDELAVRRDDVVTFLVHADEREEAGSWLAARGWVPADAGQAGAAPDAGAAERGDA